MPSPPEHRFSKALLGIVVISTSLVSYTWFFPSTEASVPTGVQSVTKKTVPSSQEHHCAALVSTGVHTIGPVTVTDDERFGKVKCSFQDETRAPLTEVNCRIETPEHDLVRQYVRPDSAVLELGARYGTTSCEIAAAQGNSGRLLAVEPDRRVWDTLLRNAAAHACNFSVLRGVVGTRARRSTNHSTYSTRTVSGEQASSAYENHLLPNIVEATPLSKAELCFGWKFDTLLIDCEGCVNDFLDENPEALRHVHTILIEGDMGFYGSDAATCNDAQGRLPCSIMVNYATVIERLKRHGFSVASSFKERGKGREKKKDCCPWIHHFALRRI
mmetsp:Transcript_79933/g.222702  ORF Transcript_79933/g.222702 Transcript_79933/m.222702 type:complete len:329 (-) Transcript_79933:191-1177(-)